MARWSAIRMNRAGRLAARAPSAQRLDREPLTSTAVGSTSRRAISVLNSVDAVLEEGELGRDRLPRNDAGQRDDVATLEWDRGWRRIDRRVPRPRVSRPHWYSDESTSAYVRRAVVIGGVSTLSGRVGQQATGPVLVYGIVTHLLGSRRPRSTYVPSPARLLRARGRLEIAEADRLEAAGRDASFSPR